MSERVIARICRCGQRVIVLNTRRGKRVAINPEPQGTDAYKFRDWARHETYFAPGEHQLHFLTCSKPRDEKERRKRHV